MIRNFMDEPFVCSDHNKLSQTSWQHIKAALSIWLGILEAFSQIYHNNKCIFGNNSQLLHHLHALLLSILIHKNIIKTLKWHCLHAACRTVFNLIYKLRVTIECYIETSFECPLSNDMEFGSVAESLNAPC